MPLLPASATGVIPLVCATRAGLSVAAGGSEDIEWTTIEANTLGATFNGVDTFTLPSDGIYEFTLHGAWTDNTTGEATVGFAIEGSTVEWFPTDHRQHFDDGTRSASTGLTFTAPCEAGTTVYAFAANSGDAGEIFSTSVFPTSGLVFTIKRLADWTP